MSHTMVSLEDLQQITGAKSQLNTVLYVGGGITTWSGSDIGAQINSAYAALPATGGRIGILANGSSNTYSFTTPIVLATSVKPVTLFNASGSSNQLQLNYTPTTATVALTIDFTGSSGSAEAPVDVLDDITLVNNGSYAAGGAGSSATGILFGSSAGANIGKLTRCRVAGFGTGVSISTAESWGAQFDQCTFVSNTTGVSVSANAERILFNGCVFGSNGTGFTNSGGGDCVFNACSFDQQTTAGVTGSAGILTFIGCHFENQGSGAGTTSHFVNSTGSIVIIVGGIAEDDVASSNTDYWFQTSAIAISISDLYISSAGRTATTILNALSPVRGFVKCINGSLGFLATLVAGANAAFITNLSFSASSTNPAVGAILPGVVLINAAPTVSASQVGLGSTTATSATLGANGAVPAQVVGYLIINVAGTAMKVPYFNT